MNDKDLWNVFYNSGKIDDYLKYKSSTFEDKGAKQFEPYNNERFDNQGTKGWRS